MEKVNCEQKNVEAQGVRTVRRLKNKEKTYTIDSRTLIVRRNH